MSLPDEAEESARNTIQAFINEADTMLPVVQDAYARLGRAAADSLGVDLGNTGRWVRGGAGNASAYASGTSNAPPGWAWVGEEGPELIRMRGGETVLPADISEQFAYLTASYSNMAAYAGGTGNASELVKASNAAYATYQDAVSYGGSSAETIAAVEAIPSDGYGGGTATPVTVEVHIHIEGSAAPETVQALEDYVRRGELQEAVADAIENIQTDARRRAYV